MAGETELERLVVRLLADVEGYVRPLREAVEKSKEAVSKIEEYTKQTEKFASSLTTYGTRLSIGLTLPLTLAGRQALLSAGQFEQTTIAFETMLGNAAVAQKLLSDLTEFAAKTPFEMPGILGATKSLLAFGVEQGNVLDTLKMLGDISAGTGKSLQELSVIFGQIRGMGRLQGQDFLQLVNAGFPVQEFAKTLGITMGDLKKRMEQGAVSFEVVEETMKRLTAQGGRFFSLMERQSESLLGIWSTLKDAIGIFLRQIGEVLAPAAKALLKILLSIVEVFGNLPSPIKVVIVGFATVAAAIGPALLALGTFIKLVLFAEAGIKAMSLATFLLSVRVAAYTVATKLATIAMIFWKGLMGPAGWAAIAAGLVVATGAVLLYTTRVKEAAGETAKITPAVQGVESKITSAMKTAQAATDGLKDSIQGVGAAIKELPAAQLQVAVLTEAYNESAKRLKELQEKVESAREDVRQQVPGAGGVVIAGMEVPLGVAESVLEQAREQVELLVQRLAQARHELLFPLTPGTAIPATSAEEMMDKAREQAKELRDMYATPFEKAKKEIEDLNYLLSLLGKKEFGETYRRGIEKTLKEFREAVKTSERYISPGVETIRRGSIQEAILKQEHRIAVMGKTTEQTTQEKQLDALVKIEENTDPTKVTETPTTIAIVPAGLAGV